MKKIIFNEIININEDSDYLSSFEKLKKKYEQLCDLIDEKLYQKKYINDSYKLGVEDANEIIAYLSGDENITMINVEAELEAILKGLFMNKKKRRDNKIS